METVVIQEAGGSSKAADQVEALARGLLGELEKLPRQRGTAADLMVGLECGGSDTFSGSPPIRRWEGRRPAGGAGRHGHSRGDHRDDRRPGAAAEAGGKRGGGRQAQGKGGAAGGAGAGDAGAAGRSVLAPGNVESGLTTIAEKSLGCIAKGGSSPIREVIDYGDRPSRKGLVVMDTPGYDIESMAGMAAPGLRLSCSPPAEAPRWDSRPCR